jgi:periplasmic protein TonB
MSAVMRAGNTTGSAGGRAFSYAVVASILLHGAVLFGLPSLKEARRAAATPGPITARLVAPPSPPTVEAPQTTPPQVEPQKPQLEPPPPAPVPVPKKSPIVRPEPAAPPKPAATPPQPVPAAPAATPSPAAPAAPPAPAAGAPGPMAKVDPQPGAQLDRGTLADYERELRVVAAKYKRYPRVAMDNNWEGTVEVSMVIGANGLISSVSIRTSSGHQLLDKQAIEMFTRAKPLVPIPPALRGKEFSIVLRAIYSLKEPDA